MKFKWKQKKRTKWSIENLGGEKRSPINFAVKEWPVKARSRAYKKNEFTGRASRFHRDKDEAESYQVIPKINQTYPNAKKALTKKLWYTKNLSFSRVLVLSSSNFRPFLAIVFLLFSLSFHRLTCPGTYAVPPFFSLFLFLCTVL